MVRSHAPSRFDGTAVWGTGRDGRGEGGGCDTRATGIVACRGGAAWVDGGDEGDEEQSGHRDAFERRGKLEAGGRGAKPSMSLNMRLGGGG